MNDFEDRLRATLRDRADRAGIADDMSRAAIGRAKTIQRRRTVVAAVTAVAVVAIAVPVAVYAGGTLNGDGPVAPPSTSGTPTSPATVTPSSTPPPAKPSQQPTQSSPPTSQQTGLPGPVKIEIDLTKLGRGARPKMTYIDGNAVVVDGRRIVVKDPNLRLWQAAATGRGAAVLHALDEAGGLSLLDAEGNEVRAFDNGNRLRSSRDGSAIAFAVPAGTPVGPQKAGATLYHRDNSSGTLRSLRLQSGYDLRIHAVIGDAVYFSYRPKESADHGVLRKWIAGSSQSTRVTTVPWPSAVSDDGSIAATLRSISDSGSCSALVDVADGSERWRTCKNQLVEIAPDNGTVLGDDAYSDGYAPLKISLLDSRNGTLLREWRGLFTEQRYEDSDHVLLVAEQDGKSAIVRCTISTGSCELATPVVTGTGDQGTARYQLGS